MPKKVETIVILRNSMLQFVEKKEFPSRKEAMDYAVKMYLEDKCSFYNLINKSDYSVYMNYRPKVFPRNIYLQKR
jgi:hypothetical protein